MKVVIAIDSFKGSMTSLEAGNAAAEGIRKLNPDADIVVRPLADGGEGTFEALSSGMGGEICEVEVTGPLGKKVVARYGIVGTGLQRKTAVMEMTAAAGITLIKEEERNPLFTTTYGVGEMIADAIQKGCRNFIIGIGGSATNDGGVGMLQALGYHFLNENGAEVQRGARGLSEIRSICMEQVMAELSDCTFQIATDVKNPLCKENGASRIFGPQKGATPEMVEEMDAALMSYARLTRDVFCNIRVNEEADFCDPDYPGAGAAGGLGYAFHAYLRAELLSGIDIILKEIHLEEEMKDADYVITGEGMLDSQTAMGKAPVGVARLAKKYGKPVFAFGGSVAEDAGILHEKGIDAMFPIVRGAVSLMDAMKKENAIHNMSAAVEQVFRAIRA